MAEPSGGMKIWGIQSRSEDRGTEKETSPSSLLADREKEGPRPILLPLSSLIHVSFLGFMGEQKKGRMKL